MLGLGANPTAIEDGNLQAGRGRESPMRAARTIPERAVVGIEVDRGQALRLRGALASLGCGDGSFCLPIIRSIVQG